MDLWKLAHRWWLWVNNKINHSTKQQIEQSNVWNVNKVMTLISFRCSLLYICSTFPPLDRIFGNSEEAGYRFNMQSKPIWVSKIFSISLVVCVILKITPRLLVYLCTIAYSHKLQYLYMHSESLQSSTKSTAGDSYPCMCQLVTSNLVSLSYAQSPSCIDNWEPQSV